MPQQPVQTVSNRLVLLIRAGHWLALTIVAAMVIAAYVLLQQTMAAQQQDESLLGVVNTQKALSQRIVFLAGATGVASRQMQPALVTALKEATAEFQKNYDALLARIDADPASPARLDSTTIENVLFGKPFHLDYFSVGLIANGERLVSAFESKLAMVDGAGFFQIFRRILLPNSLPIIVVTVIYQFTNIWNDFLFASAYAGSGDVMPMTVALNNVVNTSTGVVEYNVNMAAAMIAALPTLLVYILAGRYFVRGLMAGAVKG